MNSKGICELWNQKLSRKTYIRIYINGEKVRSTGSEKWYRELVLNQLGFDLNLRVTDAYKVSPEKLWNTLKNLYHCKSPIYNKIKVELVRSTRSGKRILDSMTVIFRFYLPMRNGKEMIMNDQNNGKL